MGVQDLANTYSTKTDEELLLLAGAPEQLTPDAFSVLTSELAKRKISILEPPHSQRDVERLIEEPHPLGSISTVKVTAVGDFVAEVLQVYRTQFGIFFRLTAPAVLLSYVVVTAARFEIRNITRHLFRQNFNPLSLRIEFIEMPLINLAAYLASWLFFSIMFAAICSTVDQIRKGRTPSAAISLSAVRTRLGPFLGLSTLLFVFCVVLFGLSGVLFWGVSRFSHRLLFHLGQLEFWIISYGTAFLAMLLLSRFALAIPAVVLDECRVGQSLFLSDELTEGGWLILAALLAKSLIVGYVAGMLPFWIRVWAWGAVQIPVIVAEAMSVVAVSVVEPVMFIGFALLYLQTRGNRSHLALAPLELAPQYLEEIGPRPI
jgi:hypothetical protein